MANSEAMTSSTNSVAYSYMYYGIKGIECEWMESYLTDRSQFVTVNDCTIVNV